MRDEGELGRLITAAVVNDEFRKLLLADPAMALAAGYNGEPFHLPGSVQELVLSIRASSLGEFAQQITSEAITREGLLEMDS